MSLLKRVTVRYLQKKGYRPPIGDWSGYQTYVFPEVQKQESTEETSLDESRSYITPTQTKRRTRALPKPSEHPAGSDGQSGRIQYKPYGVLNGPDSAYADQGATKVPIRTLGVGGEEYGHPYKLNVYPRRILASEDIAEVESEDSEKTSAKITPNYPKKRQTKQKGKAKRDWKKYYRKNKIKIKREKRKWYRRNKRNPSLRKKKKLYRNNPKRFQRRDSGGYHTQKERSQDWRDENSKTAALDDIFSTVVETYLAFLLDDME